MKVCKYRKCDNEVSRMGQYCSQWCKRKEGWAREEENAGKPKLKYRNEKYFYMVLGSRQIKSRGAGKRSGHMVQGAMAAMVYETYGEMVILTRENLHKHFYGNSFSLNYARRGDGEYIYRKDFDDGNVKYYQL